MSLSQFRWLPALRDLDEDQKKVIYNSLNKGCSLVYGPAGCGKTAITLYCAKTLQDTGKTYLVFTYTNTLLRFIRAATKELGIPNERVSTLFRWVWWEHKNQIGPPPNDGDGKYSLWVDNLIKHYRSNPDSLPRFAFILVDEAQDFKQNVSDLLHMMSDNVLIAGDTSQSLYTEVESIAEFARSWQPLSEEFELVNNYRNPKTVALAAALFLDGSSLSAEEFLRRVKGKDYEMKPVWYRVNNAEEQTEKIIDLMQQARGSVRVGILYRHRAQLTAELTRLKQQGAAAQVALSNQANYDFSSPLPTLTTVHSAKGLEFDWVILPYLNADVWDEEKDDIKQRRLFFVALTRTKSNLYLISQADQECAYLKEIIAHDASLLQSPSVSFASQTAAQSYASDDDPF